MPTTNELRERLKEKLYELFQLNQPDLDFGFYRIMHAKAKDIQDFISNDLLKIMAKDFGDADDTNINNLQIAYDEAIELALKYGAPNPEQTAPVIKARAALDAMKDVAGAEADVYDHLYRFFERYYENGDFLSRRYHTRETSGRSAPFAVPYNGEEVKLHWANADQYYIKTTDYFTNFTFNLSKAHEIRNASQSKQTAMPLKTEAEPQFRMHFRITEACEGEHGNVKQSDTSKRFFILSTKCPVVINESGDLIINFEYRTDPAKNGNGDTWREKLNTISVEKILDQLQELVKIGGEHRGRSTEYLRLLRISAPTDKDKNRQLLAKYVNQYTASNTMDYFIHKDLGTFLRRELDFYIKNEIMHLDDIENAKAPIVESYLSKIIVLRKIACKLIDFLAQLEDFQKKLWLKKKFVVETNYCITLDRVPKILHPEIIANQAQREEWIKLFAIDEIQPSLTSPEFSGSLTSEFLDTNNKLVLDTRFFDDQFKNQLVASIDRFDEQCDGLLIHSENFQALNLLSERYREQINCTYIDPPYNTSDNTFLYKNTYKHSSWLSMMANGLSVVPAMMPRSGVLMGAINDAEYSNFKSLLCQIFGDNNYIGTIAVEVNPAGQNIRPNVPATSHDYFHIFAKDIDSSIMLLRELSSEEKKQYKEIDGKGHFLWDNLRRRGGNSRPTDRPKQWFPLYIKEKQARVPKMEWSKSAKKWIVSEAPANGETEVWPIDPKGEDRIWRADPKGAQKRIADGEISVLCKAGRQEISLKSREPAGKKPKTLWAESKYSATSHGTNLLLNILGYGLHFSYPKSIHLTFDAIKYWADKNSVVLDFFAGSGTTGHATINLNRKDGGARKYILVEMGDYFEKTLKPRLMKILYSENWNNGKPTKHDGGISHCIKYMRLEGYEETLNNLSLNQNAIPKNSLEENKELKEEYMLKYKLDVETRGSQSLLNIDAFADPISYTLKVKKQGTNEYATRAVDLVETFNYLLGLRVMHMSATQFFNAKFKRIKDSELPDNQEGKLEVVGDIQVKKSGKWYFRKVEGWVPSDPSNPNNGQCDNVLIVWRNLTGDIEKDNLMLDEWFTRNRINTRDFEFKTIYVNGSNNLPCIRPEKENWKVRLLEEEFRNRMWDTETL